MISQRLSNPLFYRSWVVKERRWHRPSCIMLSLRTLHPLLCHVESNGFRYLVSELIPNFKESKLQIKSRKSYQHQLHTLWENKKKMMISSMTQARQVCLTVDHWSCRSKGYIGFTAHWFVDGNREQGAIALRRITCRKMYLWCNCRPGIWCDRWIWTE